MIPALSIGPVSDMMRDGASELRDVNVWFEKLRRSACSFASRILISSSQSASLIVMYADGLPFDVSWLRAAKMLFVISAKPAWYSVLRLSVQKQLLIWAEDYLYSAHIHESFQVGWEVSLGGL